MDAKISALPVSIAPVVSDIIPVASSGTTKGLTVGVLALNMPNLGNKGITKNVVTSVSTTSIPLTGSLFVLPVSGTPYTLANGVSGQEIVLVSEGTNIVNVASGLIVNLIADQVITLIFVGTKWLVK